MKNYYVIKDDNVSKIYTKNEFDIVQKYIKENPTAYLKGFYDLEMAENFLNKKSPKFYYVVMYGKNRGIFDDKTKLQEQVVGIKDAIVIKTRNYSVAEKYNSMPFEEYLKEREETLQKKMEKQIKREKRELLRNERRKHMRETFVLKDEYIGFIDCEASGRIAISIGIVIYNTKINKIVDTYYSLVKPHNFVSLEKHIAKLTNLTTQMINKAAPMSKILPEIEQLLTKYNIKVLYSWGPSDKKFINGHKDIENIHKFANKIHNIQTTISSVVYETFHNDSMGLSSMKKIYHLDTGKVNHNALEDAIDLTNVFIAWYLNKEPDINVKF